MVKILQEIKVVYHGHSCFELKTDRNSIIIDPHDGYSIGLKPVNAKGDIILITHEHFDHNAKEAVMKEKSIVLSSFYGEKRLVSNGEEVLVKGYKVPHDKEGGKRRGFVSVYKIKIGEFSAMHFGDIGSVPEKSFFEENKSERLDLVFVPVGGYFTIGPDEAWRISTSLNPMYVVPMHYWRKGMNLPISPLSDFFKFATANKIEVENPFIYRRPENSQKPLEILVFKGMY